MSDPTTAPPAGWLLDPADSSLLRWWDGADWTEFRRPRSAPPPPRAAHPPTSPPPPAPDPEPATPAPALDPEPPTPAPAAEEPPPPPPPVYGEPAAPPVYGEPAAPPVYGEPAAPPTGFTTQWDAAVLAALDGLDPDDRERRGELFTAIRARVVATAGADEDVFELFAVTLHEADPATGGLGAARGPADLLVTDRRALAVGEPDDPGGVVLEITLADVVRVTSLPDDGVRVDLGHAPPVLLASPRPGRRGDDLATLLTTLTT